VPSWFQVSRSYLPALSFLTLLVYGERLHLDVPFRNSSYDQLEEIVKLAAQPMPERPDGIVCVCRYTSAQSDECKATEAEYERLARKNPATIFLRCFAEYADAALLQGQAKVTTLPTFDMFYGGM
jgi:hypothetical protein